jgi:cell fate (sporulation/competence/biofilm development) regulator YmcA (YheA/YmcA/DUF963 family)
MTKLVMMMKNKVKWNVQRIRVMQQRAGDHVKYGKRTATLNNSELIHHFQSVNTGPLLDTTFYVSFFSFLWPFV